MKMGTTRSPWHYDAAARHAHRSVNLRRTAILHYASRRRSSRFRGWSGYPDSGPCRSIPGLTRIVKVFGCRPHDGGATYTGGPAYENLQGRKPRRVRDGRTRALWGFERVLPCYGDSALNSQL